MYPHVCFEDQKALSLVKSNEVKAEKKETVKKSFEELLSLIDNRGMFRLAEKSININFLTLCLIAHWSIA